MSVLSRLLQKNHRLKLLVRSKRYTRQPCASLLQIMMLFTIGSFFRTSSCITEISASVNTRRTIAFLPATVPATTISSLRSKALIQSRKIHQSLSERQTFKYPCRRLDSKLFNKITNDDTSIKSSGKIDVDGLETAPYILTFILLLCVWNFTIPTEFRRARICSEQQVIDYPSSNCKTWSQYVSGITSYYKNGGTIFQFDFSIDKDNNIWITGPQEIIE